MVTDTKPLRRRMPQRAQTPENASKAGERRWGPDARTREAIKLLVAQLRPLTEDEKDAIRALLAPTTPTTQPPEDRVMASSAIIEAVPPHLSPDQVDALRPIFARGTQGAVAA